MLLNTVTNKKGAWFNGAPLNTSFQLVRCEEAALLE